MLPKVVGRRVAALGVRGRIVKKTATPWVQETRPQFLILSVVLVMHGAALAAWKGSGPIATGSGGWWLRAILATVSLVLLHASVDVLNDWHDWSKTGIDRETPRTPFSGGSGLMPAGLITPSQALTLGVGTFAAGTAIGLYLAYLAGWPLLVIGGIGVLSVVLYTPWLNKLYLGEFFAGLGLGTFPVVGTYFLLTGRLDAVAWISGIPAGLLTYNLLLLNEFPDVEADARGGRRHMVTLFGKRGAAWLYSAVEVGVYVAILAGVATRIMTPWTLLGLVSAFFAFKAIAGAMRDHGDLEKFVPSMGANVIAVLSTNVLLAVGYVVGTFTGR